MNDMQPIDTQPADTRSVPPAPRKGRLGLMIAAIIALAALSAGAYYLTRDRMPDLDHPYTPRADLPKSIQDESAGKVAMAVADLRDNPGLISRWLELAAQFKGIYDYDFAEEIYLYVIEKFPDDFTAYANLADMYRYEMKRYGNSVTYWRKVVAMKPDYITAYRELHFIYRYNMESDEGAAVAPLLEGLEKNPGSTDLLIPLANYYRDVAKDDGKARQYFTQARDSALKNGNAKLVAQIDEELRALPR